VVGSIAAVLAAATHCRDCAAHTGLQVWHRRGGGGGGGGAAAGEHARATRNLLLASCCPAQPSRGMFRGQQLLQPAAAKRVAGPRLLRGWPLGRAHRFINVAPLWLHPCCSRDRQESRGPDRGCLLLMEEAPGTLSRFPITMHAAKNCPSAEKSASRWWLTWHRRVLPKSCRNASPRRVGACATRSQQH